MTRLRSLPSPTVIAALKGKVDIATWRNEPYARAWPRKPALPRSPAVQATAALMAPAMQLYAHVGTIWRGLLDAAFRGYSWSQRDAWFHYAWIHPPFLSPSHVYCGHPYPAPQPDPWSHTWTITGFSWRAIYIGPVLQGVEQILTVYPPLRTLVGYRIPGQSPWQTRVVMRRGQARICGVNDTPWTSSTIDGWTGDSFPNSAVFRRFISRSSSLFSQPWRYVMIAGTRQAGHAAWSESPVLVMRWSTQTLRIAGPTRPYSDPLAVP